MLILAGLLILPCLLLAQEQASNPPSLLAPTLSRIHPLYDRYFRKREGHRQPSVTRSQLLDPFDTRIGQTPTKPLVFLPMEL